MHPGTDVVEGGLLVLLIASWAAAGGQARSVGGSVHRERVPLCSQLSAASKAQERTGEIDCQRSLQRVVIDGTL